MSDQAVLRVLVEAFDADPSFRWLLPDSRSRARAMAWIFRRELRNVRAAGGRIRTAGDPVQGALLEYPPGSFPPPWWTSLADVTGFGYVPLGSVGRGVRMGQVLADAHYPGRHVYVHTLGVAPEAQGKGLGRTLLEASCAEADVRRVPVYLETAKPANVAYYRRFGFEPTGEAAPPGGPTFWFMLRP